MGSPEETPLAAKLLENRLYMSPISHNKQIPDYPTVQQIFFFQLYKDAVVYIRRLTGSEKPPEEDPADPGKSRAGNKIKHFFACPRTGLP